MHAHAFVHVHAWVLASSSSMQGCMHTHVHTRGLADGPPYEPQRWPVCRTAAAAAASQLLG
eukprot:361981-Chlamydomonas_euryale.AAC.4